MIDSPITPQMFSEAGIAAGFLFLIFFVVACGTYITSKFLENNKRARVDKKELLEAQTKLEDMRAKNTTDLTTQITMLTTQISKDREHDREIREKELDAVNKLVTASEETHGVIQSHVDSTIAFRAVMTNSQNAVQFGVTALAQAVDISNQGITRVEQSLTELRTALSDLPNAVQKILSPYCERMEIALKKLETPEVEEKPHDKSIGNSVQVTMVGDNGNLDLHASDAQTQRAGNGDDIPSDKPTGSDGETVGNPNPIPETDKS